MITLRGGVGLLLEAPGLLTRDRVEDALQRAGFPSGFHFALTQMRTHTEVFIHITVPVESIATRDIPLMPAAATLQSLADVVEFLNQDVRAASRAEHDDPPHP